MNSVEPFTSPCPSDSAPSTSELGRSGPERDLHHSILRVQIPTASSSLPLAPVDHTSATETVVAKTQHRLEQLQLQVDAIISPPLVAQHSAASATATATATSAGITSAQSIPVWASRSPQATSDLAEEMAALRRQVEHLETQVQSTSTGALLAQLARLEAQLHTAAGAVSAFEDDPPPSY